MRKKTNTNLSRRVLNPRDNNTLHTEPRAARFFLLASLSPRPGDRCRYPTKMKTTFKHSVPYLAVAVLIVALTLWWYRPVPPVSATMAENVPVVLRVSTSITKGDGGHEWAVLTVLDVYKNTTKSPLPETLHIGRFNSWKLPPKGTATVYLVPFDTYHLFGEDVPQSYRWKLKDPGDETAGFSHHDAG